MIKIIGAIMIILSCSATGFSVKKSLSDRKNALRSFLSAFELIRSEIIFRNRDVPFVVDTVCEYCEGAAASFFNIIRENEYNVRDSFEKHSLWLEKEGLSHPEISEIKDGLYIMGRYDREVQAERLSGTIRRIEEACAKVSEESFKKGKIYTAFGISVGMILALILI